MNTKKLLDAVTVQGIMSHERVFQRIANQNGGTRASGAPGFEASRNYVAQMLRRAHYNVQLQQFDFDFLRELAPATLSQQPPPHSGGGPELRRR